MPGGRIKLIELNRFTRSSGKSPRDGEILGAFNEKGVPKPGIGIPDEPVGWGIDMSEGLHGIYLLSLWRDLLYPS